MPTRKKKRRKGEVDVAESGLRTVIVLFLLFSLGFSIFVSGVQGSDVEDLALFAIARAESAVDVAYQAVLEAEKAGADVSSLLGKLNAGAEALSDAHMYDRAGDFDDVVYHADLCYDLVAGTEVEANELGDAAAFDRSQRLLLTSCESVLAIVCILCGGLVGWGFLKSRHHRRVLEMKPEVVNHES